MAAMCEPSTAARNSGDDVVDLRVHDPYAEMVPEELIAAITVSIPMRWRTAPTCTRCGAARGESCVTFRGKERAYHAERQHIADVMDHIGLPIPDGGVVEWAPRRA